MREGILLLLLCFLAFTVTSTSGRAAVGERALVRDDGTLNIGGRIVRPRHGANLVCQLAPPLNHFELTAVLRNGTYVRHAKFDPVARFANLLPGVWQLEVVSGENVVHRRRFELKSGDFMSYVATAEANGPFQEVER